MRLDYKILWIEDDDSWITDTKEIIKNHLEENGFEPHIHTCNGEEFNKKEYYGFKDYDLMLIDYNLDKSLDGKDLIKKIRDNEVFTNIVFYSSRHTELVESIQVNEINGVYIYNRDEFEEDKIDISIFKLIDFFLEKELDLNSMRGIAMSEIAQFDKTIWCILAKVTESEEEIAEDFLSEIKDGYKTQSDKQYGELSSPTKAFKQLNSTSSSMYFGSHFRSKVLYNQLSKIYTTHEYCKTHTDYLELLKTRNKLAHCMDNDDSEIFENEDAKIKFRKDLLNFRRILKETEENIVLP